MVLGVAGAAMIHLVVYSGKWVPGVAGNLTFGARSIECRAGFAADNSVSLLGWTIDCPSSLSSAAP